MSNWIVIEAPESIAVGEICKFCEQLIFQKFSKDRFCYINPKTKEHAHIRCLEQGVRLKREGKCQKN